MAEKDNSEGHMLDKTIPHMGVLMVLEQAAKYPIYSLPDGYTFELYQDGYENSWAKMQYLNGQIDSFEEAQMCFDNEFKSRINEVRQNMFFVKAPSGQLVATASIWDGKHFGETKPRIHWVSVNADQQGKGLAKALMTRVMDRHMEMDQGNFLYLTSQTWSY
jgi:predicted GNAT family acetyltransferase